MFFFLVIEATLLASLLLFARSRGPSPAGGRAALVFFHLRCSDPIVRVPPSPHQFVDRFSVRVERRPPSRGILFSSTFLRPGRGGCLFFSSLLREAHFFFFFCTPRGTAVLLFFFRESRACRLLFSSDFCSSRAFPALPCSFFFLPRLSFKWSDPRAVS